MKEYKIFSFEEIADSVGLSEEEHRNVRNRGDMDIKEAIRRQLSWPEGFLEKLRGKTIEEQMSFYRIVEEEHYSRTAYGEITKENKTSFGYALEDYDGLTSLIVDDGILIGVRIISAFRKYDYGTPAFPYRDVCTYYADDNNGSGSKCREDYAHLCCVVPDEE